MPAVCLIRGPLVSQRGSVNNEPTPPIGLAYLAGSLRAVGYPVRAIDATAQAFDRVYDVPGTTLEAHGIALEEVVEQIPARTRVIGISATFSHEWLPHRTMIAAIRQRHPDAVIVAGGEHPTALAEYCLDDCPALDCIALGEGEETLVDLCQAVGEGRDLRSVPGLVVRANGDLVRTPPRARIRDVDAIPLPDWSTVPIEPYLSAHISFGASFGRNMPIMASRGCPYQCTFCSNPAMWTTRYTTRSPELVLAEILHYRERYDITGLQFYDLTAIVKKDWIIRYCRLLVESGLKLDWSLPSGTRSEALDDEALGWLARANCRYLVYAPESGSPSTLRTIKKKIRLDRMEDSVRSAVRRGIVVRANLIIGFPEESRRELFATVRQALRFAWTGVDEVALNLFQPYPGTELFENLRAAGRLRLDDTYFETLATFSSGNLGPPRHSYSAHLGRIELCIYRLVGMAAFLILSYLLYPKRVWRSFYNIAFTQRSATVMEQRVKDRLRHVRAARRLRRLARSA
jgi:radical SAM superfamily enzyme YgiQ (UPF0313 family)